MKPLLRLLLPVVALMLSCAGNATADSAANPFANSPITPTNLKTWLESVRVRNKVPALAVTVVYHGRVTAAATGFRKFDDPTPVTDEDSFHLGSCTKSMTATMLAFLVQDGRLTWDSTVAGIFPELAAGMRSEYCAVTLRQLLNHRAGMPAETWPAEKGNKYWRKSTESMTQQRLEYVKAILSEAPVSTPGTQFVYANRDYILAGAMAERVAGKSWEELMRERIFKPLHMDSASFGATATEDKVDGVWSHYGGDEKLNPTSGSLSDNPALGGPAAAVHCTMADWGKFILFQLRGARGEDTLLAQAEFTGIFTPPYGCNYAFGWKTVTCAWGDGTVLQHNGTNTGNCCIAWLAPRLNFAVLVATNTGDGAQVCDEVATALAMELGKH